jgi:2-amino-4-hydroxy-6-hydroxymethyldihydropteridine diphosphokinase
MHSRHDFLNCLFVVQSDLSPSSSRPSLSPWSWPMAGSQQPLCKVADRPLDIDILACGERDDFAEAGVDAYLGDLLAEMYQGGSVDSGKVTLPAGQQGVCEAAHRPAPIHLASKKRFPATAPAGPARRHPAPLSRSHEAPTPHVHGGPPCPR